MNKETSSLTFQFLKFKRNTDDTECKLIAYSEYIIYNFGLPRISLKQQ